MCNLRKFVSKYDVVVGFGKTQSVQQINDFESVMIEKEFASRLGKRGRRAKTLYLPMAGLHINTYSSVVISPSKAIRLLKRNKSGRTTRLSTFFKAFDMNLLDHKDIA